jgi:PPM family protein phosphatase
MTEHGRPAATATSAAGQGWAPADRAVIDSVAITVATASNGHQRNEDAIGINGWLLTGEDVNPLDLVVPVVEHRAAVVALTDGLAGADGGDVAAALAGRRLTARHTQNAATPEAFRGAFLAADEMVHRAATAGPPGMGCSAAAVLIRADGRAFVGNVGDVRLYRVLNGYLGKVTRDDRASGADPVVTRCLGGRLRTDVDAHLTEIPVLPGDRLLLCSDGLYDALSDGEIERVLNGRPAGHAIAALVRAVKKRRDGNVTVALLELTGRAVRGPIRLEPVASVPAPPPHALPAPQAEPAPERKRWWRPRGGGQKA